MGTEVAAPDGQSAITDYYYDYNGNTTATSSSALKDADESQTPGIVVSLIGYSEPGSTIYEYNDRDQLIKTSTGDVEVEMTYNGDGLRSGKDIMLNLLLLMNALYGTNSFA